LVVFIKKYQPALPTRRKTNLALQFPSCPLDAAPPLRDGAHSIGSSFVLSIGIIPCFGGPGVLPLVCLALVWPPPTAPRSIFFCQ
jgi:hypothetical protein